MTDHFDSPTLSLDKDLIDKLRADLRSADWTVRSIDSLLSPMAREAMDRDQLVPASVELEGNQSPAAVLTRLFVLAEEVALSDLVPALPTLTVGGAERLGLLRENTQGTVHAVMDLRPHSATIRGVEHHWWVASDLGHAQTGEPPREDYVLGIASASTNLLRLTMRDPVESALDLGCGCGILALYLTTHARRVVATDIAERACNVTRFNALLNEADIDVRQGSLFEPVADETFDLITSNPPFVITPKSVRARANLEYRDGGMERDSLIPLIIKQAVGHLRGGGTLQMLANWEVTGDPDGWAKRPSEWIEAAARPLLSQGGAVDAWLIQRDLVDVSQYAEWWMRDAKGDRAEPEEWAREYREWLKDFQVAGTTFVGLGSLALRAKEGPSGQLNLVCEYLPDGPPADGESVNTALANLKPPDGWGSYPLVRAEDVREVRYYVPGSADPELVRITQGRPGGRDRTVPSSVAALIGVSDGELSASQVVPAIAMFLGKDESEIGEELTAYLPELLRSGVLKGS